MCGAGVVSEPQDARSSACCPTVMSVMILSTDLCIRGGSLSGNWCEDTAGAGSSSSAGRSMIEPFSRSSGMSNASHAVSRSGEDGAKVGGEIGRAGSSTPLSSVPKLWEVSVRPQVAAGVRSILLPIGASVD